MSARFHIPLLCCLFTGSSLAQPGGGSGVYKHELSVTTENDAYLFQEKDAYYTNGIFLNYRTAYYHGDQKRLSNYELGQKIFTPFRLTIRNKSDIDRPFCGFLYARFSQTRFLPNSVFQWSATLGQTGKASLGEALQDAYHHIFNYKTFNGWQYQVPDALGLDLSAIYARPVVHNASLELEPMAEASLGMNYTQAGLSANICLGHLADDANSVLWHARADTRNAPKAEWFLFWKPELICQVYNATLQGGLMFKGNSGVYSDPAPLFFQQSIGICLASGKWSGQLAWISQTRETPVQIHPQQFASIQLNYLMP
ncbi:MAG TPA: lipid A deacylase LpxR family protein [Sediminibacterium sp.]|nr:lipid A deacylase LpxR family protein [Sediminibacterium sp.]